MDASLATQLALYATSGAAVLRCQADPLAIEGSKGFMMQGVQRGARRKKFQARNSFSLRCLVA